MMNTKLRRFLTTVAFLAAEISMSQAVTIDMVSVGNAGNAADPLTGYGSVSDAYAIGKYEVTIGQYSEFLNAVAATDSYSEG